MLAKFIICIFICFSFCFGLYAVVYDSSKPKEETYEEKMQKKDLSHLMPVHIAILQIYKLLLLLVPYFAIISVDYISSK